MRTSEKTDKISTAIQAVQQAVPFVEKTKEADQGSYKVKYAPHELVWDRLKGACKENGLVVFQGGREGAGGSTWLVTRITHAETGQYVEADTPVVSAKAGMQGLGAVWSYGRRIGLLAILGIVPKGEDTDAADDHAGRSAKPPRVERAARPAGVPPDAAAIVERVLKDLPGLTTKAAIDEAAKELKGIVPPELNQRVRESFAAARERLSGREPGSDG